TEAPRDVARAVVRHHLLDAPDAMAGKEAPCSLEEIDRCDAPLVGEHLGVSQARSIVDGDVDELVADAGRTAAPIAMDAVTDYADFPQWFHIQMDELAG